MMMMMNELPLTWYVALTLPGHVTVKTVIIIFISDSSRCTVGGLVRAAVRPSKKVMAMAELTPTDCSKQML